MRDPELEMAMALEGKFFWEPSRDPDHLATPLELAIKNAQKQFYKVKPRHGGAILIEDIPSRVERIVKMTRSSNEILREDDPVSTLRKIVAFCYEVTPAQVSSNTSSSDVAPAKQHFYWTALRQFSTLSLAEIARQVGRNHAAIIHARGKFEKVKHTRAVEIEIVDRAAEEMKCGF